MVETLTATEIAELLSKGAEVVDVRDADEYATGHIPGARLVPLDDLRADVEAALPNHDSIVFVCARGVRSLSAAKLAARFGYTHIYSLDGGTQAWAKAGLPIEATLRAAA